MLLFYSLILSILLINPFSMDPLNIKVFPIAAALAASITAALFTSKKSKWFNFSKPFYLLIFFIFIQTIKLARYYFMAGYCQNLVSYFHVQNIFLFLYFIFLIRALSGPKEINRLTSQLDSVMAALGGIAALTGLIQFWKPHLAGIALSGTRPGGISGNPNSLGLILSITLVHAIILFYKQKNIHYRFCISLDIILIFSVILFTRSLGAYIMLAAVFTWLLIIFPGLTETGKNIFAASSKNTFDASSKNTFDASSKNTYDTSSKNTFTANFASLFILFFIPAVIFFYSLVKRDFMIPQKSINIRERLYIMKASLKCALENPLSGCGPDMLYTKLSSRLDPEYYTLRHDSKKYVPHHAHCEYLETAAEHGFLTLFFELIFIYILFKKLFSLLLKKHLSMEHEIRISSLILIISIFCGTMLFSVNMQYFDVRALYLFYISTALIYILYNQGELNIQPHVSCESIKKAFFGIKCLILIFLLVLLVFKTKNIWNNFQGNNLLFNLETLRAGRNPALYKPDIFEEKNSGLFADKQFYEKYSKALILCPENLIARKRYISFIIADSRFDRALKLIDQFVKCAPFFGDIINLQALVFYKTGHYIKAGENFLNYAVKIPFNESAYMNALFSFMEAKSYEQALKTIEYAKKRAPNSAANSPEAGKTRAFLKNLEPFEKKVKAELKIN